MRVTTERTAAITEKLTAKLRHVWREINDGNGDIKVLALQQWVETHDDSSNEHGGYWVDVEIDPFN